MVQVADITSFLAEFAPLELAEEWDNVGLLLGDSSADVSNIMTCLTLTPDVAAEAIAEKSQLIVSHHPILFRPIQQVTSESTDGQMLLDLISAGVAVYSPHTSYDSAVNGINQQLAELFGLSNVKVLRPMNSNNSVGDKNANLESEQIGAGRFGDLPSTMKLSEFNSLVKQLLEISNLQYVGDDTTVIQKVGIACGSAAAFLRDARSQGCDILLTGEARFHAALESRALKIPMVLAGHYATERPAMEKMVEIMSEQFPGLNVWASRQETDPVRWD